MQSVTEHSATIVVPTESTVSAKMEVFYNPLMASNRNISIALLNNLRNEGMNIADPLAGSGIRSLRFMKELTKGRIQQLFINDAKLHFPSYFSTSLQQNNLPHQKTLNLIIGNEDANLFLLHHPGFDYIDIDPFGSPNPFLAAAVARISRHGVLAVTATDTAALTGTYPAVTKRKYWATTRKTPLMHELGLRVLIRKIQLQGVQFDKALTPILAYHKDHYFRAYFRCEKSKEKGDTLLQHHQYFLWCAACFNFKISRLNCEPCICGKRFEYHGPLWTGALSDSSLLRKMVTTNQYPEEQKFLELLLEESKIDVVGFINLHALAKLERKEVPPFELILKKYNAVRTHFSPYGIKTKKSSAEIRSTFR